MSSVSHTSLVSIEKKTVLCFFLVVSLHTTPFSFGKLVCSQKIHRVKRGEEKRRKHPRISFHDPCSEGISDGVDLLLGRVVGKVDALLDVALQPFNGNLQQLLLLGGNVGKNVDGLLGTVGL
jgi:hypothetical protein